MSGGMEFIRVGARIALQIGKAHPPPGRDRAEGERKMTTKLTEPRINFEIPAVLRKWPSLRGERRIEGTPPYFLVEGTLDECVRALMAKPASMRHLYEIHTSSQPPLVSPVLSGERVLELAMLQDL
jgi:hypothetical protein